MKRIHLEPNQPLTLKLVDPFADSSERYDSEMGICEYRTEDGRILALPRAAAIQLNELAPKPGEEISVCRYTGKQSRVAIWLTASSEKTRATQEEPSDLTQQLAASIEQAQNGKAKEGSVTPIRRKPAGKQNDQPRLFDRGTGTDGPVALPAIPLPAAAVARDQPFRIMLLEVIVGVEWALKQASVQLGDAPKQDLYSTVYIDWAKRQGVRYPKVGTE